MVHEFDRFAPPSCLNWTIVYSPRWSRRQPISVPIHWVSALCTRFRTVIIGEGQIHDWAMGGIYTNSQAPVYRDDVYRQGR